MKLALCEGTFSEEIKSGKVSIIQIIDLAVNYGFDALEIRLDTLINKKAELSNISLLMKEKGIKPIYAFMVWPLQKSLQDMKIDIEKILEAIEDMDVLGANILKIGFGSINHISDLPLENLDEWQKVVDHAAAKNIMICMENSDKYPLGDPSTIQSIMKAFKSPFLKTTFDCGNYYLRGTNPLDAFKMLSEHIGYIHLKDVVSDTSTTTYLGNCSINFSGIFRSIKDIKYDGYICFEFCKSIDRIYEIGRSMRYLIESFDKEIG